MKINGVRPLNTAVPDAGREDRLPSLVSRLLQPSGAPSARVQTVQGVGRSAGRSAVLPGSSQVPSGTQGKATDGEKAAAADFKPSPKRGWYLPELKAARKAETAEALNGHIDSVLGSMHGLRPSDNEDAATALMRSKKAGPSLRTLDSEGRAPALLRKHAVPLLRDYLAGLQECERENRQPRFRDLDRLLLPLLIESENAHKPGMALEICDEQQLGQMLQSSPKQPVNRTFVVDFLCDANQPHRAAGYYQNDLKSPPWFTIVDSTSDPSSLIERMVEASEQPLIGIPSNLNTQRAPDCTIFAIDIAKRIHAQRDRLAEALGAPKPGEPAQSHARDLVEGNRLPHSFSKYAQTMSPLIALCNQNPEVVGAPINKHGPTVDLFDHWNQNKVTRTSVDSNGVSREATYSTAAESLRRKLVSRALEHFSNS